MNTPRKKSKKIQPPQNGALVAMQICIPTETMTTVEIVTVIKSALRLSEQGLIWAAEGMRLLRARGLDPETELSDVSKGVIQLLTFVGEGQLLPKLAFCLLGNSNIASKVVLCSKDQQQQLADAKLVEVSVHNRRTGRWGTTVKPLNGISAIQANEVFGPNGLRSEQERKVFVATRELASVNKPRKSSKPFTIVKTGRTKIVRINIAPYDADAAQLTAWLKAVA